MASLTREFIAERDYRIFQMRKAGTSVQEIARRMELSVPAVNGAIERTLSKLSKEALMAYPQVLQMELERLDALLASTWPLTQHRRVVMPDGSETVVEPDQKFIAEARGIIKDRIKLLGLETTTVNVNQAPMEIRHTIPSVAEVVDVDYHDPKEEAQRLMEIMAKAGILSKGQLAIGTGEEIDGDE